MRTMGAWRRGLLASVCLVCAQHVVALADEPLLPVVSMDATPNSVQVAEPLTVTLTVRTRVGDHVTFPEVGQRLEKFEVLEYRDFADIPVADNDRARDWIRRWRLESFHAGQHTIPALVVEVASTDEVHELRTEPVRITVVSVLESGMEPTAYLASHPTIDVPVDSPSSATGRWWWVGGMAAGLLLLTLGVAFKRRQSQVTAETWASAELAPLETMGVESRSEQQAMASRLSQILYTYAEMRFSLPPRPWTTVELCELLERHRPHGDHWLGELRTLLARLDQVRFGGRQLTTSDARQCLTAARQLVQLLPDPPSGRQDSADSSRRS